MKFLCLAWDDERALEALPPTELNALVNQCPPHDAALRASGRLVAQASLGPSRETVTLRPAAGRTAVTDGPYIETKEQIGGFFIIEADSLDEAIRVASLHPAAVLGGHVGWGVEVRSIETGCRYPASPIDQ